MVDKSGTVPTPRWQRLGRYRNSLVFRMMLTLVLVQSSAFTLLGVIYLSDYFQHLENDLQIRLNLPGVLLKQGVLDAGRSTDRAFIEALIGEKLRHGWLIGADYRIKYSLNPAQIGQDVRVLTVLPTPNTGGDTMTMPPLISTLVGFSSLTPLPSEGYYYLEVDRTALDKQQRIEILTFVFLGAIGLAMTVGLFLPLSQSLLWDRLRELARWVAQVEAGNLNVRSHATIRPDEIGQLQRGILALIGRLRETIATLSQALHERQGIEDALRQSEARWQAIMEHSPAAIYLKDVHGRFLLASRQYQEWYGIQGGIQGKTVYDFFAREHADVYTAQDWQVLAQDQVLRAELEMPLANGGTLTVLVIKFPVYAADGTLLGIGGINTDISDRKRTEQELQRLRNLLSNILDSMPSVVISVDTAGRVVQWNREAERLTGLPMAAVHGQVLAELFPQWARELAQVQQTMHQRQPHHRSKITWQARGETRFADLTIYPLVMNGVEGAVIRVDDVTERVRIEEMMIQSEKMLSVGGLAAGMAHEINNPLAGILQNAQVLRNRLQAELPKNQTVAADCGLDLTRLAIYLEQRGIWRMLDAIQESGQRAARIVQNMLDFSRKSESRFHLCDLRELLDKTVELAATDYDLKKRYDIRHIGIVREYAADLPPVRCEAGKLQQVLLNILRNGAEAMISDRQRGRKPQFVLRLQPEAGWVRLEIEDNGPGMPATVRKRVFEPFFTTKGVGEGTGLGLSVSYFIITEDHGGTLTVESSPGHGARFIIRLPLERVLP